MAVTIRRHCKRRSVWGTWLLVRGWGGSEAWLMKANWLCQVGTALAWHHFKSYRTTPWRRCVLFCSVTRDMTSLLPQSRGEGLQTWDPQELFWLIKQGPHGLIFLCFCSEARFFPGRCPSTSHGCFVSRIVRHFLGV